MNTRWLIFTALGLCLTGGLIAAIFAPSIEAALTLPEVPTLPTLHTNTPVSRPAMPPATLTPAIPSPVSNNVNILARDTFQRPDQAFWGTASDGRVWVGDANTVNAFSIVQHAGQVDQQQGIFNAILGPTTTDAEVVISASINHLNPNSVNVGTVLRWTDNNNWYKAFINGTELVILKRFQGSTIQLGAIPFSAQSGQSYTLRFRALGATLFARVWRSNDPEPTAWMLTCTDTGTLLLSGSGGLRLAVQTDTVVRVTSFLETSVTGMI
jgi:hypothetical protein